MFGVTLTSTPKDALFQFCKKKLRSAVGVGGGGQPEL